RRHTRFSRDWSSDVCSSDLTPAFTSRMPSFGGGGQDAAGKVGMMAILLLPFRRAVRGADLHRRHLELGTVGGPVGIVGRHHIGRSEERRVGKEGRAGRAAWQ